MASMISFVSKWQSFIDGRTLLLIHVKIWHPKLPPAFHENYKATFSVKRNTHRNGDVYIYIYMYIYIYKVVILNTHSHIFKYVLTSCLYQFTLYITTRFTVRYLLYTIFHTKNARDSKKLNISYTNRMVY